MEPAVSTFIIYLFLDPPNPGIFDCTMATVDYFKSDTESNLQGFRYWYDSYH